MGDLDKEFKKATQNSACLYLGCNDPPISSHVIARNTLDLIDEKGHVFTWLPLKVSAFDMARNMIAGRPLKQLYEDPISVGIGDKNKITYPLFCQYHDTKVFAPIDSDFSFEPEQVVLLAFRALCAMTFSLTRAILEVSKSHGYQHSLNTPASLARLERFQAGDSILKILRCTYTLAAEDVVSFSLLPYPPLNNSICVISWLRESLRGQRFMTLNKVNELSEKEQQDFFLRLAFEAPTPYISPEWWNALSRAKQEEYKSFHHDAGREHAQLVY